MKTAYLRLRGGIFKIFIVVLLGLALGTSAPDAALASLVACRTDPIVFLSDGERVQVTTKIATDASAVTEIVYGIHAPVGTSVTRVVYTGGPLREKERVVFYDDLPPRQYMTSTLVRVEGAPARVTATAAMRGGAPVEVSGWSGEDLIVSFDRAQ